MCKCLCVYLHGNLILYIQMIYFFETIRFLEFHFTEFNDWAAIGVANGIS